MNTITITFEDNTVVVTDGRHTETSNFNKITDESKRALIALANFYGYEPAHLLDFEGLGEYEFEDDIDDDNDFLQGLANEAATEETIEIWFSMLLESTGKSSVNELTVEELRKEKEEVEGTIRNEEITLGLPNSFAKANIHTLIEYLVRIDEMLKNKGEK